MKSLPQRFTLSVLAGCICLLLLSGCQSAAVDEKGNAAMSEKQKAVIKKHHAED